MKLYEELKDGSIQVRKMVINPQKANKYILNEMSSIPAGKRVFNASCTDDERELSPNKICFSHKLNFSHSGVYGGRYYHKIYFFEDMDVNDQMSALKALKDFYSCTKKKYETVMIVGENSEFPLSPQYVLLGAEDYDNRGKMNNNIVVPKSLMELQRLQNGNLDYANYENIHLFDISDPLDNSIISKELFTNWLNILKNCQPINIKNPGYGVSKEDLIKLLNLGFGVDSYNKVKQTEKVLKLKQGR